MDREAWWAIVHGIARVGHSWVNHHQIRIIRFTPKSTFSLAYLILFGSYFSPIAECFNLPSEVSDFISHWALSILLLFGCYVWLFVTTQTVACQAPPSRGFPRQEYWSGLPFPSPGDLPNPGMEPASPALAGRFFITEPPGKPWALSILRPKAVHLSSSYFSSKQHLFP